MKTTSHLSPEDCFQVVKRPQMDRNGLLHVHFEYELYYLEKSFNTLRVVEDSVEEVGHLDLVLIAGGTKHAYINHEATRGDMLEVTVHFSRFQFDSLLDKRHFKSIKTMFDKARGGLVFSQETIVSLQENIKSLTNDDQSDSFSNLLRLIAILKRLSLDDNVRRLNAEHVSMDSNQAGSDRLESIISFLHANFRNPITLQEVSSMVGMSEASLNRFLKRWTGKTFVDHLNDIRIFEVTSCLINSSDTVSEICYKCGFNNLSNFNCIFKKRKGCTPTEYRMRYAASHFSDSAL